MKPINSEICVDRSILKVAVSLFLGAFSFALGLYVLTVSPNHLFGHSMKFLGYLTVFLGLSACLRLKRAIVLDPRGIHDNSAIFSFGYIRWEEISHLKVYEFSRGGTLSIVMLDVDSFLKKHWCKRLLWLGRVSKKTSELKIPWKPFFLNDSPQNIGFKVRQEIDGGVLWQGEQDPYPD